MVVCVAHHVEERRVGDNDVRGHRAEGKGSGQGERWQGWTSQPGGRGGVIDWLIDLVID